MNKKVLIIDVILLLIAICFEIFCAKQGNIRITVLGAIVMCIVIGYILVSSYFMLMYQEKLDNKIKGADKTHKLFARETTKLLEQLSRLENRENLFEENESNDNLKNAYELIKEKVTANINTAIAFMKSYDYVARPNAEYLYQLINENDTLLEQLNKLIELNLKADNTSYLIKTDTVEDLIMSLEHITRGE